MKHTLWEIWVSNQDNGTEIYTLRADEVQDMQEKGLMQADAVLVHRYIADSPEEASAISSLRLGFGPYKPMGKPVLCSNQCGSYYYPEGSGICPKCRVQLN